MINAKFGTDPANSHDYSGKFLQGDGGAGWFQPAAGADRFQPAAPPSRVQPAAGVGRVQNASGYSRVATVARTPAPVAAPAKPAAKPRDNTTRLPVAIVTAQNITSIRAITPAAYGAAPAGTTMFSQFIGPIHGLLDSYDKHHLGEWAGLIGLGAGCIIGGAAGVIGGPAGVVLGCGTGGVTSFEAGETAGKFIDAYNGARKIVN